MQSTSPTWRGLFASGASLQARAIIGGVAYTDISAPVISRATMQDRLAVGNVVSASLALAVRSTGSIPRSAAVVIEVRLNDGQTASEWLPQGTFYVSRRTRDPVTGVLALECYDALLKANAVWTPSAGAWPRALAAVTAELAALLGVDLDSRTVIPTGAAYAIRQPAAGTTIRDALSQIAQAAGGNWIVTPAGRLRLIRLGEAGDTVDVAGVVGGIDVGAAGTITGVRSTVDGVVTLTGDDTGIVVDVTVAPVIAAELAERLIGQAWQPFRLDGAIYDPAAELGDGVRAGAGGEVASALCSEQAAYGPAFRGNIAAPDPGELTDEYPYLGSADKTLALAKAAVAEAVDRLDGELTQQEIFNRLTDDGAAQGLVLYNGQLYVNASYVNAGYLSAARIKGDILTLGGENNVNGTMRVLDAGGNVVVTLNNEGADITDGSVIAYSNDRRQRVLLADGIVAFQFYNDVSQPFGWVNAFSMSLDSTFKAKISTVAYGADRNLDINGGGKVSISNRAGLLDEDSADIDMDEDSIEMSVTSGIGVIENASIQLTPDSFRMSHRDPLTGDTDDVFEFVPSGASDTPLSIGNGGTGATNAAAARASLGVTPANIGAVNKDGDTMTGDLVTDSDIVLTDGLIRGEVNSVNPTNHAIKMGHADDNVMDFYEYGGEFNFYQSRSGNDTLLFQVANGESDQPLPVNNGGTGATDAEEARENLGVTPANIGAVAKSGDTMSGSLQISNSSECGVFVDNTANSNKIALINGNSGNSGVYSVEYEKYILQIQPDGSVYVNGNAATASTLKTAGRQTSANNIYGDGKLRVYLSSDSMTSGKPPVDGIILHGAWDWESYNGQLCIGNNSNANLYIRGSDGRTWGNWHKVFTDVEAIPIANGGTGATTAASGVNNLLSALPTWTATPTDDTYFIRRDTAGAASFGQVKFSTVYDYIKNKASGTWGINVTGNAANVTGTVAVGHGGTGATTAAGARKNLGFDTANIPVTLSANGASLLPSNYKTSSHMIISAYCAGYQVGLYTNSSGVWGVKVTMPGNGNPVTGAVTVTVAYYTI